MPIIGIICEYNPLHNGHIYHLNKIKEAYPNSLIILVLNGYFLERGEISILTKENKTKLSLKYGVDIVLELPFVFGTQSADTFANCAIKILNNFKVDKIIFGSEENNPQIIKEIAKKQINNKDYDTLVKQYLSKGINYPTALAKALNIKEFKFQPNDLLGISYTKSILLNKYNIEIETIKRTNDYKDIMSDNYIISASNIREKLKNNIDITKYIPKYAKELILDINYNKYFELLKYKINTSKDLAIYLDVDEGIENRLKKYINKTNNINDLIELVKTKRYTYNKINRMLIHILIGLTKKDNKILDLEYIKILGFNKKGQKYLNSIKDNLSISTKVDINSKQYKYEINAAIVYDLINNTTTLEFEQNNKPIKD